jgi:hypothetical protein
MAVPVASSRLGRAGAIDYDAGRLADDYGRIAEFKRGLIRNRTDEGIECTKKAGQEVRTPRAAGC